MTLAIMQPYIFPYVGYFQLLAAADKFVVYDDAAFIKQGWVNRNRILVRGRPHLFSVPLQDVSSNRAIHNTLVSLREYPRWRDKFLKTIAMAYSKAPGYQMVCALLSNVLSSAPPSIGELALRSILSVREALGLATRIEPTSSIYNNAHLHGQERVLDICAREGATVYLNATGARELYARDEFASRGVELRFLRSRLPPYAQFNHDFVPALSILDVLMFNPLEDLRAMLREFDTE